MDIREVLISELKPAEYNPRKLSPQQESSLKESLAKFGFVDPIVVNSNPDRNNVIIGGHQRLKVWGSMGNKTVPVFYIDLDKDRERELNIRLNKTTGEWDWDLLQEFFQKDELLGWGFSEDDLFGRFKTKTTGDDDIPGTPATRLSKRGDVYDLGNHRVMRGDSTSNDVLTLMRGELANMIWTDPPYNVNYKGAGEKTTRTIENDNMDEASFREFLFKAFQKAHEVTTDTAEFYFCYASRTHREFEDSADKAGWKTKCQIIWIKNVASFGFSDYPWKHEPILYCGKVGNTTDFYADRKQNTAWEIEPTAEEKIAYFDKMVKKQEDGNSTVWRVARETNYMHPTVKPVALVTKAVVNSCKTHGIVLDLFGGSGSTLIAAEKNDRRARIMEFDPGFVDVIVKRYADFCMKNGRKMQILKNNEDISAQFTQCDLGKVQGDDHADTAS